MVEVITVQGCNNRARQWIHYSVTLDGCQMEVFNIFSFSPDKIQFGNIHIYIVLEIVDIVPYDQRNGILHIYHILLPSTWGFASIDGIMFHTKNCLQR